MSGLDGLGWPNPNDEPKPTRTMNSQLEIKLATKMTDTPETDAMEYCDAMCDPDRVVEADFARKLERERDEARQWESQALVARIQRDRLAEALEEACDNPTTGNWYREAQDALAAADNKTPTKQTTL